MTEVPSESLTPTGFLMEGGDFPLDGAWKAMMFHAKDDPHGPYERSQQFAELTRLPISERPVELGFAKATPSCSP